MKNKVGRPKEQDPKKQIFIGVRKSIIKAIGLDKLKIELVGFAESKTAHCKSCQERWHVESLSDGVCPMCQKLNTEH